MYFPFSLSPHRDRVKSLSDFRQERSVNLGVSRFLIRSIVYGSPITSSDSKENFQNPDNQSGIISRNSYALSLKLSCHLRAQIFIRHAAIRLQRLLSLPMLFISSEGNCHPYFPHIAAPTGTEQGSEANPVSHDRVSPAAGLPLYCAKPGNRFSLPGKQPFLEKSAYPAFLPLYFAGIFQLFSVSQSSSSSW